MKNKVYDPFEKKKKKQLSQMVEIDAESTNKNRKKIAIDFSKNKQHYTNVKNAMQPQNKL